MYSYGGWSNYSLDYGFPLKEDVLNFQGDSGTKPPKGGLSPSEGDYVLLINYS